jgi:hypothetical protein
MLPIAKAYWRRVARHPLISRQFAGIAERQQAWLDQVDSQLDRLA